MLIKSPTFKDSCCRFDIVEKHVDEFPYGPISLNIMDVYLVSVEAYKVMDKIPITQDGSHKTKGLELAHGANPKFKKKPLPPNLRYKPPYKINIENGRESINRMDIFKWNPIDHEHIIKDLNLKEVSS